MAVVTHHSSRCILEYYSLSSVYIGITMPCLDLLSLIIICQYLCYAPVEKVLFLFQTKLTSYLISYIHTYLIHERPALAWLGRRRRSALCNSRMHYALVGCLGRYSILMLEFSVFWIKRMFLKFL